MDTPNWAEIGKRLAEPFAAEDVDWRIQGKAEKNARCQLVAYIDARTVQDRLDSAVGIDGWSFDWQAINFAKGKSGADELASAKGTITIGGVSKSDIGTASQWEADKGTVSDCFKRAAVMWGIGRHLYTLPQVWVTLDDSGHIPAGTVERLRERYKEKFGTPGAHKEAKEPATPAQTTRQASKEAAPKLAPKELDVPIQAPLNGHPRKPDTLSPSTVRLFARKCGFATEAQYEQLVTQVTRRMYRSDVAKHGLSTDELSRICDKALEHLEYATVPAE